MSYAPTPIEERFWPRVAAPNARGCRLWTGGTNAAKDGSGRGGYGQVFDRVTVSPKTGRKSIRVKLAHRLAYELTAGPIPKGMVVMHTCDERACCEPSHLVLGTPRQNTADMLAKRRGERDAAGRWA